MTALALDIGGTKLMCALVEGDKVLEMRRAVTDRAAGPAAWLRQAADLSAPWSGRYGHLGIAVTGRVDQQGRWSALNRATLDIPQNTPLAEMAASLFGCPARAVNDAQAAAWAEYHFGAGCGQDMVFLTISTGIGGGIVEAGRLMRGRAGLAGHFGQICSGGMRLEDRVSGRWLLRAAAEAGHEADAEAIFAAAARGEGWAVVLRETCLASVATLSTDIQLMIDPAVIVIGGGIGLSPGFVQDLDRHLLTREPVMRPRVVAARLGAEAGVIGAAALAMAF